MKKVIFIFLLFLLGTLTVIGINTPPDLEAALDRSVNKVAVQSNGQVILAGEFGEDFLIRVNSDNSIDSQFARNVRVGLFNRPVRDFAILKDDSLIVVGEFTSFDQSLTGYIAKLDKDGNLDSQFIANTGAGFDDVVTKVKILSDGKIMVVGQFSTFNGDSANKIAVLLPDGTLDTQFNASGTGFDQAPQFIVSSPDQKDIYITGPFSSYNSEVYPYIVKMNARGIASESFGLVE